VRRATILGATGSIGQNTVDLIAADPERWSVIALTGNSNAALLAEQARRVGAEVAVVGDEAALGELRERLAGSGIEAAGGRTAILEAAARATDWTMSAIVGAAGLEPGLHAIADGGTLALANKETLVAAGPLVMEEVRASGATLLPVDSEHSAIFQALCGEDRDSVERVIITASGGAFRDWPLERLRTATPAEAACHPNWEMGQRITIDSASLFNKALELIEAKEYFGLDPAQIEVVIHPQSLIHALVGFTDGALMAHLGPPDMRHAIGYAMHWPERRELDVERLDLAAIANLTFRRPDEDRWPALRLARQVMRSGGLSGAAFNAAKETALDAFIGGRIGFSAMADVVEETLDRLAAGSDLRAGVTLEAVLAVDHLARNCAGEAIRAFGAKTGAPT
jgi:1-deoxy-D-xylulose-5-phosphate reductoisomerase